MSALKKIILILVGSVLLLIVVVVLGRNFIIKASVPTAVKTITGFDATVGDIDVGLFSSTVGIKELKLTSPSDFGERRMLDAPDIYVEYKLSTLLSHQRQFPLIRLGIQEIAVVKNKKGESNVARIMAVKPKSEGHGASDHFGTLELSLDKIIYVDYSRIIGGKPLTKETTLHFHGVYHNLSDDDLKKVVMWETLKFLPARLHDITPDSIQKELGGVTGGALGVATNVTGTAVDTIKKGLGDLFQKKGN